MAKDGTVVRRVRAFHRRPYYISHDRFATGVNLKIVAVKHHNTQGNNMD